MKKKAADIKNGCQTAKKRKQTKKQKCTLKLRRQRLLFVWVQDAGSYAYCVAFAGSCRSGVIGAGRCWVWGRRRWSLLGAGSSPLVAAGCGVVRAGHAAVFCAVRPPTVLLHFNFG